MLRVGNGIDCDFDIFCKCFSWLFIDVVLVDVKGF